ncbi:MAG: hypothetical protein AB8B87_24460 [Granulosicoccus sp.]
MKSDRIDATQPAPLNAENRHQSQLFNASKFHRSLVSAIVMLL